MITHTQLEQKIDNVQHQLNSMAREGAAFRGYVNKQFERIYETMATKDDLRRVEARLSDRLDVQCVIIVKIAQKLGVSL